MLGREDHGCFTFNLTLKGAGWGIGAGGYCLDHWDEKQKKRICGKATLDPIDQILKVVGVDTWEELKGQYVRVVLEDLNGPVKAIGNLLEDKWFDFKEYFKNMEE